MRALKYSVVDLFAGIGGLSLGFELAGATVVSAVESNPHHAGAYKSVHRHEVKVLASPIEEVSAREIFGATNLSHGELDFLVGGPPCQPFSMAGKRLGTRDRRGNLVWQFERMLRELRPRSFVMENVVGMRSIHSGSLLSELLFSFERLGYRCECFILDAADYGVPQNRKRLFIVGAIGIKRTIGRPPQTHVSPFARNLLTQHLEPHRTVRDAIWDLRGSRYWQLSSKIEDCELVSYYEDRPSDYQELMRSGETVVSGNGITLHFPHILKKISKRTLPEGAMDHNTRYRRLYWDRPAFTLRAGSGSFTALRPIHPSLARVITVREAARLQSFPDYTKFTSTKKWAYRQIGNSVPPLLGEAIARHLIAKIFQRWGTQK